MAPEGEHWLAVFEGYDLVATLAAESQTAKTGQGLVVVARVAAKGAGQHSEQSAGLRASAAWLDGAAFHFHNAAQLAPGHPGPARVVEGALDCRSYVQGNQLARLGQSFAGLQLVGWWSAVADEVPLLRACDNEPTRATPAVSSPNIA